MGQQLILAKVYKWFNGANVCVLLAVRKETPSPSVRLALQTHRLSYAATILTIWTSSVHARIKFLY